MIKNRITLAILTYVILIGITLLGLVQWAHWLIPTLVPLLLFAVYEIFCPVELSKEPYCLQRKHYD